MDRHGNTEYRRPENAPDMPTECPVCCEELFDEKGIAQHGKVAKIMCQHLVHSDCLAEAGRSLNSDGSRYGIGGLLGMPRAGCPICAVPVSFWVAYSDAAAFPIFWMHRIQEKLEEIGATAGPISVLRVKKMLKNDPQLTKSQKKYIHSKEMDVGFPKALSDGDQVWVNQVVDGGPENGGYIQSCFQEGIWDFDKEENTLWLHKWGDIPLGRGALAPQWMQLLLVVVAAVLVNLSLKAFSAVDKELT